jgi:1-deoxyxylulose-5-phosphate synthase
MTEVPAARARFAPSRPLGRTGFEATALGIGDLADRAVPIETCVATVKRAIDAGLNVIDTAPGYEDGYSEEIVGRAVAGVRDRMFVIDKIDDLKSAVAPQIEASLRRLSLEFSDAFVFHNVSEKSVLERLLAPGGGFEQLDACIRAGKTRFRGISSHNPEVLRIALEAGCCDVVMFPVGPFVDRRYISEILPLARRAGAGSICFKTFGAGKLLGDTPGYNQPLANRPRGKFSSGGEDPADATLPRLTVQQCLDYTLSVAPDVALLGLSYPNEQDAAFAAAAQSTTLSARELLAIERLAAAARKEKGACWWNPEPDA